MASVITVANEQVSIVTVLQMLGVSLPDDIGDSRSRKICCPFGAVYHSDGGVSPAMRVYPDTNSVYCFSCSWSFTAVRLAAKAMDVDQTSAARRLLDRIGYQPQQSGAWGHALRYEPALDTTLMADALKTYCRRVCAGWATRQFDVPVAAALTRCLTLLDLVTSGAEVGVWLAGCKRVMDRALLP